MEKHFKLTLNQSALIAKVCDVFQITLRELEESRFKEIVRARRVCYYCFRKCGYSTVQIGYIMDREHATIMNALKYLEHDADLCEDAEEIFLWYKTNYPHAVRKQYNEGRFNKDIIATIKNYLNDGQSDPVFISEQIKQPYELVKSNINYINTFEKKKLIPNYKNGTIKEKWI